MKKRSLNQNILSIVCVVLVLVLAVGFVRTSFVHAEGNDITTVTSLQNEEATPTKVPYNPNRPITPFNCDK